MDVSLQEVKREWINEQSKLREKAVFRDEADFWPSDNAFVDEHEAAPLLGARQAAPVYPQGLHYVGGLDISYDTTDPDRAIAVLAVLRFPTMEVAHLLERDVKLVQPYMPSFLAFREADHLLDLVNTCPEPKPQLLFVDGNGRLHEREAGLAVDIGVRSNLPTLAVAKNYQPPCHDIDKDERFDLRSMTVLCRSALKSRGDWLPIPSSRCEETVGAALLSSPHAESVKPVYVSSGHRVSLRSCLGLVLACCLNARVPEPIRVADHHGRALVRKSNMVQDADDTSGRHTTA